MGDETHIRSLYIDCQMLQRHSRFGRYKGDNEPRMLTVNARMNINVAVVNANLFHLLPLLQSIIQKANAYNTVKIPKQSVSRKKEMNCRR